MAYLESVCYTTRASLRAVLPGQRVPMARARTSSG
ncbi:hypothetical protein J2W46_003100 [Paraburkholderia strydomiana]|nr:hypothetical protein [Paraburkholderia strydomiana]